MQFIDAEMVKEEMAEAVRASDMLTKMVMDECKTVGRGLLATAFTYAVLARACPVEVELQDLHDILDMAHRLVSESEGKDRVIQ